MREIKFRGWSIYDEKWVYGYLTVKATKRDLEKHYFIYSESGMSGWRVDPESVGQYSGVKDKDGLEIYEGDLINWIDSDESKRQDEVTWKKGGLVLCNDSYNVGSYSSIEVVGNMFENKELLNENVQNRIGLSS